MSPTENGVTSGSHGDEQLAILVSEDEMRVVGLPSHKIYFAQQRLDIPLVKARASPICASPALFALTGAGNIQVYSLPSLHLLINMSLLGQSVDLDDRYSSRLCLTLIVFLLFQFAQSNCIVRSWSRPIYVQFVRIAKVYGVG
jgi:hypothetical protein